MAHFDEATWERMLPKLKERCPRLTAEDLAGCERRSDLLISRIQNRQWISVSDAQAIVFQLMKDSGHQVQA